MFTALLFAAQVATAPMDFDQAKARADANEAGLGREMHAHLLDVQGEALHRAVDACRQSEPDLSRFTVVLSLRADGTVASSWLRGRSTLAHCVRNRLVAAGLPGHWPTPFYTSFEVSFGGH